MALQAGAGEVLRPTGKDAIGMKLWKYEIGRPVLLGVLLVVLVSLAVAIIVGAQWRPPSVQAERVLSQDDFSY